MDGRYCLFTVCFVVIATICSIVHNADKRFSEYKSCVTSVKFHVILVQKHIFQNSNPYLIVIMQNGYFMSNRTSDEIMLLIQIN